MAYISEGIKRLRAVYVARREREEKQDSTRPTYLWRGMKMLDVGDEFLANRTGGTEVAPMSTTTDLTVAIRYGLGPESLLFMLKVKIWQ